MNGARILSEYKAVTWNNGDPLTRDKLTAMVNNDDWLMKNTPRVRYTAAAQTTRDVGTKILCGRFTVPANAKVNSFAQRVQFGQFFSTGCLPVISLAALSYTEDMIWMRAHSDTSTAVLAATSSGMIVRGALYASSGAKKYIEKSFNVDWIAVGW